MAQPLLVVQDNFVGMIELQTLPERFRIALSATLNIRMEEAADQIVDDAQAQLVPGHGYDTGLLHDTLTKVLVDAVDASIYEILSKEADYWKYVEFGHMLVNGQWWEGYHYIANAIEMNRGLIWDKARQAFSDAIGITYASGKGQFVDFGQG